MVFAAQFASIRGIWTGFLTRAGNTYLETNHKGAKPIDLVSCLEFRQQRFEKTLPNPCLLPVPKVAQAGVSGRKSTCRRKGAPGDASPQDKQDASNDLSKVTGFPSRELNMTILRGFGQQRFQAFAEVV